MTEMEKNNNQLINHSFIAVDESPWVIDLFFPQAENSVKHGAADLNIERVEVFFFSHAIFQLIIDRRTATYLRSGQNMSIDGA